MIEKTGPQGDGENSGVVRRAAGSLLILWIRGPENQLLDRPSGTCARRRVADMVFIIIIIILVIIIFIITIIILEVRQNFSNFLFFQIP